MANKKIEYPLERTYFIAKKVDLETDASAYGVIEPNQVMETIHQTVKEYKQDKYDKWKEDLAKAGVIINDDDYLTV